jgi:hypothetical protein
MKSDRSKIVGYLDNEFSIFIRKRDGIFDENSREYIGICITCDTTSALEAGHFIDRQHMQFRYDPKNVYGQCKTCNEFRKGNIKAYKEKLIKLHGIELIEYMEIARRKPFKISNRELSELLKYYKRINKRG